MSGASGTALRIATGNFQARNAAATHRPDLAAIRLHKSFDNRAAVLHNVSFEILPGESVALIGANGAGKSTLLRCAVGLIPIDDGKALLFGKELSTLAAGELRALRARVGFVFQQHNLVPRLSALSNVLHGSLGRTGARGWFQALSPRVERERAVHYLDLVGLADFAGRWADRLSGGQSQRVAIARALMQEPRVVIADEPVASLDPKAAEEVMGLFARLMQECRVTFMFTSHNLQQALTYSERLLGLHQGELTLDAPSRSQSLMSLAKLYESTPRHLQSPAAAV
jgi:phosphonate transport system ATP-binding protein